MKYTVILPQLKVYDLANSTDHPDVVYGKIEVDAVIRDLILEKESFHRRALDAERRYYQTISQIASEELKKLEDESTTMEASLDTLSNVLGGRV